jgi:hypothetical protein
MKQAKHSDTPAPSDHDSSSSSDHVRKNYLMILLHRKMVKGILIILGAAVLISIYVLANRRSPMNDEDGDFVPVVNGQSLEVEVLDGAGNMRAVQRMTNFLRAQGYDVVEMKKNNGEVEERTFLFDRSGNLDAAKKLAAILGVSQDKVFQKIDHTLYLDITVVVGKDYTRLKAFQSSNERIK